MPTGKVKWFNKTKGFGFIAPDEGDKDIFVHISALERSGIDDLADDQKVIDLYHTLCNNCARRYLHFHVPYQIA